jgi:hypothetical protein
MGFSSGLSLSTAVVASFFYLQGHYSLHYCNISIAKVFESSGLAKFSLAASAPCQAASC